MSRDTRITKILFLAVNPKNTDKLRLDEEFREIQEALRRSKERDKFVIESRLAVRPDDIRRAILDFDPQIVHFCGHGEADGGLVLEDVNGQMKLVKPEAIARLFEQCIDTVECVLLNARHSYKQVNAIVKYINYAIGMKQPIGDTAAIKFAIGFYDALGAGKNIEVAYKFGVNAIQLEGIPEELTPTIRKKPNVNTNISNSRVELDSNSTIEVFFSYASEDEKLRNQLEKHLSILKRQEVITGWHHRKITAGKESENDINIHLNTAQVILLLISSDFIASDYCWDVELKRAMKRHEAQEARVIPVILKPVDNWQSTSFGKLQPLPKNGKPVVKWGNRDEAFRSIAKGIREAIEDLTKNL